MAPPLVLCAAIAIALASCSLDASGAGTAMGGAGGETAGGSGGEAPVGGEGGLGGASPTCGDGSVGGDEGCDDGNDRAGDGCADCSPEPGYACSGSPSLCDAVPVIVTSPAASLIGDDAYDGTLGSTTCVELDVPSENDIDLGSVTLSVAIDHPHVGDLVVKLRAPSMITATLMSRPGLNELADDGTDEGGNPAALSDDYPITFDDEAAVSAESMGVRVGNGTICQGDAICAFASNSGAARGNGLADLVGEPVVGKWLACVGDAAEGDIGSLLGATLSIFPP